ncbi:MAG: long-chain-fatty-acid--CoA ligase [Acidovorax soli]|uniref:long-chain-fatty-acid--CoA ligase n=1 Tax=Acidovorax soli TaxID=592050 RepID=UPI0026EA74E6|nr:long-chain-fatty-acid--CoA ligase [Acidovorax soli]MCM2345625.1 long-chain-fatty-acid--CoA ligase [Acidovorax soli]
MPLPLRVIDLLRHAARNHPQVEIVSRRVEGDVHRYTYSDAYRRVCSLSRALTALGVSRGDKVASLAWNTYRHLELYYGTMATGAVCHTLNPRLTADQLVWICNHADDRVLCFDASFAPLVNAAAPRLKTVTTYVLLSRTAAMAAPLIEVLDYEELLARQPSTEVDWPTPDENAPCGLCYTSGTTGDPKGVCYTPRSTLLHTWASALPDALGLSAQDTVMPVVPMFHVNAWGLPFSLPMVGAKVVFPGPALDGKSLYELCETEGVTMAAGVPTIWQGMLEHVRLKGARFGSLRRTVIGGSAAGEAMVRTFELDHDVRVLHGWGMTETSPVAAINQFTPRQRGLSANERMRLKTKQGRELFGVEMRLESEDGRELARDGVVSGRLLVRGPWVVETYQGGVAGARADGWFDTGDIATIDADGFLLIVDRAKDVIKSGGEWISSIELENAAMTHPAVLEAAVIGVPHPKWDERPLLVCVPRAGHEISREQLLAHLQPRVAKWWLPDAIEFAETLPHGATGKVLKTALRERFAAYRLHQ